MVKMFLTFNGKRLKIESNYDKTNQKNNIDRFEKDYFRNTQ